MLDIYEVEINGYPATLQLSDEDAKERGLKKSDTVAARREAEAERRAAEEAAEAAAAQEKTDAEAKAKAEAEAVAKAAAPANKSRTPANKTAGADQK